MKIISDKNKLIKIIHSETNLGFVPTMGAIHKGHISLIKRCINECKKIVVSIYINKPQFHRKNDFKKYPRYLKKDISKLMKEYVTPDDVDGYLEPFCGACSILSIMNQDYNCTASDYHPDLIRLWKEVQDDSFVIPTDMTETLYNSIKEKSEE